MRRILLRAARICAWVILWTLTIAAAVAIALVLVARSGPGRRLATRAIVPALEKRINGKVTVGKLEGDLTRRVILKDVVVRDATGQVALRIHRLVLDYDLLSLARGRVELQSLTADGAELHLRELPDGRLNLASLLKQSESKGKPLELEARHVDLEGQVTWARARWPIDARFHASGSARRQGGHTDVTLTALTVHARRPLTARLSAAGALHLEDGAAPRLDGVRVTARAQGSELARLAPRLPPLKGLYRAQLSLGGTLDELVLHATVAPPRGSLALDGVVGIGAGTGLAWRGTLSARGLDPAALIAGAPPGVIELAAAGHGRGHQASVTLSRLHADAAGAHLDARGEASFARSLTARGTVDFDSRDLSRLATLGVPALAGALSVHARLSRAAGHNRVDANVHGRELEAATASLGTLDARIHARDLRGRAILHARDLILPVPSQHAPLRLDAVELAMSGDRRALALTLDARGPHGTSFALAAHGLPLDSGRGADVTIDRLLAALRGQRWESVRPGRLKVDAGVISGALALGSRHQRLTVSGSYRLRDRTLAVALDGQALDARRLAALVKPSLTLPRTELALHLTARGRLPRPSVEVSVHGTTTKAPHLGLGAAHVSVEARFQARRIRGTVSATSEGQKVSARADLPITVEGNHPVLAEVRVVGLRLAHLRRVLPKLRWLRGTLNAEARLGGTTRHPRFNVQAGGTLPPGAIAVAPIGPLGKIEIAARGQLASGQAQLTVDARLRGAPILHATAESPLDPRRLSGGRWRALPFSATAIVPAYDLSRLDHVAGTLAGELRARGPLSHPTGTGRLAVSHLRVGETEVARLDATGALDRATLTAELTAAEPKGGRLHAQARVPVPRGPEAGAPLSVTLDAHDFRFALAEAGPIRRLGLRLDAQLAVTGTGAKPTPNGTLRISDGTLALKSDPHLYRAISVELAVAPGRLTLKNASLETGSGSARADGSAALVGLLPSTFSATVHSRHFPIASGSVLTWIDATLEVKGERHGRMVAGVVTVKDGTAHLPKLGGRKLQPTGPLADVVFVDAAARRARAARRRALAGQEPVRAHITAHIPGPFKVRSEELRTDLHGNLEIDLIGALARITGQIESSWGTVDLLGRPYKLERARIGFSDRAPPDPNLDIRLTRAISEATIIIEVHGTALKPKLALASDPPIYDQSQLVGIIVSGDPGSSRLSDHSLDQKVLGAVSSLVVNKLKEQVLPGLPIDVIRFDSGGSAGGLAASRLEVGKYLTDNIYVSYVHQFGEPAGLRRVNSNEAQLDYRFAHHYEIDTVYGDAGVGAADLYWTIRY